MEFVSDTITSGNSIIATVNNAGVNRGVAPIQEIVHINMISQWFEGIDNSNDYLIIPYDIQLISFLIPSNTPFTAFKMQIKRNVNRTDKVFNVSLVRSLVGDVIVNPTPISIYLRKGDKLAVWVSASSDARYDVVFTGVPYKTMEDIVSVGDVV